MATTVLTDMTARLEAAAADVVDLTDRRRAALELRDELIIAAVDGGMSLRAVARAARVTSPRVVAILARPEPE